MPLLLCCSIIILLQSCGVSNVYQIAKLKTDAFADLGKLKDSILIVSNHWGEGGNIDVEIWNKSSQILRIDLNNSFIVKNNISTPLSISETTEFGVAPKSLRKLENSEVLSKSYFSHCDLKFDGDSTNHVFFNIESSPISYHYYFTILNEDNKRFHVRSSSYYISELYGLSEYLFLKRVYLEKCGKKIYKENGELQVITHFTRMHPNSFYFKNKSVSSN